MSRYDQGEQLAAQARDLIAQRISAPAAVFEVVVGLPALKPTLLERLKSEAEDLEQALATVSAQLAKRQAQILELERYPEDDPFTDDTVLRFKKVFPGSDKKYIHTASKVEGLWYVTGDKAPNGVEWFKLVGFMGLGVTEIVKIAPGRATKVAWSEAR